MKVGKVSENVLKRSVIKQINQKRREEIVLGAGVGEDCSVVSLQEDEMLVLSTDPITGTTKDIGALAVTITVNDLASSGAEPIGLMVTILLPPVCNEEELKQTMAQIDKACEAANIQVMGGHTEVTRAVNQPLISVTGVGKVKKGKLITTAGAKPGMDIVVTKWIGLEGTSIIAKEKEEELQQEFTQELIEQAKGFDQYLSVLPEAIVASKSGVAAMHDITEGGVYGALWEMAEASGVGLKIQLRKIPIRQETVELCEYFGIHPYQLISSGSMLIATENGTKLVEELKAEGIPATLIGYTTEGKDRVLCYQEECRFLEPPKTDELYRVLGKKKKKEVK